MKMASRYLTPLLAAAAITGATGLAPVAVADPGTTGAAQGTVQQPVPPAPTSSLRRAPAQPPSYGVGVDPLVEAGTGADPFVLDPRGYGPAF